MEPCKSANDASHRAGAPRIVDHVVGRFHCQEPKLAVVIPCHNYEQYVAESIASVLSQESVDCEVVVIDDGPSDQSWHRIVSTGVQAYRIENSGARRACVFGAEVCKAPFILFLDADDVLKPGSLAKIIHSLDNNVAKLQFSLTLIDDVGAVIGEAAPKLRSYRERESLAASIARTGVYTSPPTSGNVFRRDVCQFVKQAEYDRFVDGVALFIAPFLGDVVSLSEELGCYRVHGGNASGLGRALEPAVLKREIQRFEKRMEHMKQVLQSLNANVELIDARQTYFFMERTLHHRILEGEDVSLKSLSRLLYKLWRDDRSLISKAIFTSYFLTISALPKPAAERIIAQRFNVGRRSPVKLFQAVYPAAARA